MDKFIENCKQNPFRSVSQLFKFAFLQNILLSVIMFVMIGLIFIPLALLASTNMTSGFWTEYGSYSRNMQVEEMSALIERNMTPALTVLFIPFFLLIIYLTCVQMAAILRSQDAKIRFSGTDFSKILFGSFGAPSFKILGAIIIVYAMFVVLGLGLGLLISSIGTGSLVRGLLMLLQFILMILLLFRLTLTPAAIVHGKMGVMRAMAFSWKKITFRRSAILLLASLVGIVLLALTMLTLSLIMGALSSAGAFGAILSLIIFMAFNCVLYQLFYSALTVLYFRYSDEVDFIDTSDHLNEYVV